MRLSYQTLKETFEKVLLSRGVEQKTAQDCATMFADTTLVGVSSHGVNRFPRFIAQLDKGDILPDAKPTCVLNVGAIEQWDAHQGIGNLIAKQMMKRAMTIADRFGIGVVALKNANHWMRGGTYGAMAAEKGYVGICWTNTIAVMPPWGAKECRIGTNPLIIAIPTRPVTMVDMSCSMFSYGKLEEMRLQGKETPIEAGFDDEGKLSRDPKRVALSQRLLPMGYWKGSGLSIVLDMMATLLADGESVASVTEDKTDEYGVSQIFIAMAVDKVISGKNREEKLNRIMDYVLSAKKADPNIDVRLPGHQFERVKEKNKAEGIWVDDRVWASILAL